MARENNRTFLLLATTLALVALAAVLGGLAWVLPTLASWTHSGHAAPLSAGDAIRAVLSGGIFGSEPAGAYDRGTRGLLPGAVGFWSTGGLVMVIVIAAFSGIARAADVAMSRPVADRRWYQFRGRKAHEFGRYRTLGELIVRGPAPDRVIVGTIGRPKARLAVSGSAQIAVIAAPRTGKTAGIMIPAVLEHEGPLVTTSVRGDIADATLRRRASMGRVFVWDPFGERTDAWDLLEGCQDWEHALLVARWLGQARMVGEGITQDYFDLEAADLVAPLLHAAALSGDLTAPEVFAWIRDRDERTPTDILLEARTPNAAAAQRRLQAAYAYTERQRDGIIGTAKIQLSAYDHPAAARTARRGEGFSPARLFDGQANTLYIVAGREHQQLLAPLVVTMICSLMFWLSENENRRGALDPPALLALDETAQIAPLQSLPQMLATSLPSARFLTVWHSVAQLRRHFGVDAAAEILALSQAKVFMGSITDQYTRQEIVELLGRREQLRNAEAPGRGLDVMSAQALQRTGQGEGLLIHGDLPPVVFQQRRHYKDAELQRLKRSATLVDPTCAGPTHTRPLSSAARDQHRETARAAFVQPEEQAATAPATRRPTDHASAERADGEQRAAGQWRGAARSDGSLEL
jgi:type IV secretion system protein VirD4